MPLAILKTTKKLSQILTSIQMLKNDFGKLPNGSWVYLNNNGDAVTGEQTIRGKKMCFMSDGIQVKGKSALGNDANSGIRLS